MPDELDLELDSELDSLAEVTNIEGHSPRADGLTNQALIADHYRKICEAALAIKISDSMDGISLLLLAGHIMDDGEFSMRLDHRVAAWRAEMISKVGENFMISSGVGLLEEQQAFPLQVASSMTHDEKVLLRKRLQKIGALPKA